MAFGTNLNSDILSGGSDLQGVTTGAPNGGFMILWMNVSFHFISTPIKKFLENLFIYTNVFVFATPNLC
jgi:hypothetical protein